MASHHKHNRALSGVQAISSSSLQVRFATIHVVSNLGTVYTDAVSFVTASVSMRLHLSFTWSRPSSLSKPGRFEYAFKSGAFSKRYGFEVV